jgi:hypothetical protein
LGATEVSETWLRIRSDIRAQRDGTPDLEHLDTDIVTIESQKRYRFFLIVLLYFVYAMIGITVGVFGFVPHERELLYRWIFALILTHICIVDCRIVGKPLSIFSYWLVFILYGVAVPVCIVRARGIRGVGIVAVHLVGLVFVHLVVVIVTSLLMHGRMLPF